MHGRNWASTFEFALFLFLMLTFSFHWWISDIKQWRMKTEDLTTIKKKRPRDQKTRFSPHVEYRNSNFWTKLAATQNLNGKRNSQSDNNNIFFVFKNERFYISIELDDWESFCNTKCLWYGDNWIELDFRFPYLSFSIRPIQRESHRIGWEWMHETVPDSEFMILASRDLMVMS